MFYAGKSAERLRYDQLVYNAKQNTLILAQHHVLLNKKVCNMFFNCLPESKLIIISLISCSSSSTIQETAHL